MLELAVAAHSGPLAWSTPGPGGRGAGGLRSMGSRRVGHDWGGSSWATRPPPAVPQTRSESLALEACEAISSRFGWCDSFCFFRGQMCVLLLWLRFTCWWFCANYYTSMWLISLLIGSENTTCPQIQRDHEDPIHLLVKRSFQKIIRKETKDSERHDGKTDGPNSIFHVKKNVKCIKTSTFFARKQHSVIPRKHNFHSRFAFGIINLCTVSSWKLNMHFIFRTAFTSTWGFL